MILDEVNEFIKNNRTKIDTLYRQKYHFMGEIGWINDPNGFIYMDGKFHLFYQYVPYDGFKESDGACWGHAISEDLFKWEYLPVAIVPDQEYDKNGCWSGSSIYIDGVLYLFYTGNRIDNGVRRQTINIAYSFDGIHFQKHKNNPVIIPDKKISSICDFRDPYIFKYKNDYCILIGTNKDNKPCLVLYKSRNLIDWVFVNYFYRNDKLGTNFECPTFTEGKYLICSPQNVPPDGFDHFNVSSSVFLKGMISDNQFHAENCLEIDHGLEFYAPQTTMKDDKTLLIAWFQMWGRKYINQESRAGWEGCLTLPREIEYRNRNLYQNVPCGIKKYFKQEQKISLNTKHEIPTSCYLLIDNIIKDLELCIGNDDDSFVVKYNKNEDVLTISRETAKIQLGGVDNSLATKGIRMTKCHTEEALKLEIYLDTISNEIFINDGVETMSSLFYFTGDHKYIWSNKPMQITIHEIVK